MEKRKLELAFIDKYGKVYPLDEVTREELAKGLEKISKETAKRLLLLKTRDRTYSIRFFLFRVKQGQAINARDILILPVCDLLMMS